MKGSNQNDLRAGSINREQFLRDRREELTALEKMRADLVADFPTAKDQIQKVDSMISDVRKIIKGKGGKR